MCTMCGVLAVLAMLTLRGDVTFGGDVAAYIDFFQCICFAALP